MGCLPSKYSITQNTWHDCMIKFFVDRNILIIFHHINKDSSTRAQTVILRGHFLLIQIKITLGARISCSNSRGGARGGLGAVAPSSGKNFVSVGEFLTENCVIMHIKIPFILLFSPPVEEPSAPVRQILAPPLSNREDKW